MTAASDEAPTTAPDTTTDAATDRHVQAYGKLRERVAELARAADDAACLEWVPATPDWRVHDLIAHVVGVSVDVLAGNIDGAGSDPWTARQVETRRDRSIAELLDEWDTAWPSLAALLPLVPSAPRGQILFDAVTHEHDLRGALGQPGARYSEAMAIGYGWGAAVVGQMRDGYGAGALELRTEDGTLVVGHGDVTASVRAPRLELLRAMTGRRSASQVLAFEWEGEPALEQLCFLPPRLSPLVE